MQHSIQQDTIKILNDKNKLLCVFMVFNFQNTFLTARHDIGIRSAQGGRQQ